MVSRPTSPSLLLLLTCLSSLVFVSKAALTVPCKESSECAAIYRKGSECNADGFCTNPFYNGGCLNKLLPGWNKTRICNSEDPPEAEELGYCRSSPLGYSEIRLAARNWEAANFGAWILQILLSEILDVPTSVEGGSHDLNLNLYDVNNGFDIGVAGVDPELKELEVAARVKDCRLVTTDTSDPAAYEPCMHVNQEAYWSWYTAEQKEDFKTFIEPPRELGAITENAFFLPLFAAKNDPTLVSFAGLSGEDNRRKLAETFKTPTTWKQYCEEISETNCAEADVVAARAPQDEIEEESYFVDGLYIGHFRYTPEHDCDLNPSNCQGHLVDVPCGWATYAPSQMYHLDIALRPQNYPYEQYLQIYYASNATRTPIVFQAYTIDPIYANFIGTDAEMTRVLLTPPTQECLDNRNYHVCGRTDLDELVGSPLGACDTEPEMLKKAISRAFREIAYDVDDPEEFWSPAFDAVENYQLTVPLLGEIYRLWDERGSDKWNYDPRDAVCQFVVDNFDMITSFVPDTHPRVVEEVKNTTQGLSEAAIVVGSIAVALVLLSMVTTYAKRKKSIIYHTQVEFMNLVLFGMLLVSTGAIVMAIKPSDDSCVWINWLTNLGYAFQFSPLLVRISSINKLTSSGKAMQRIRLRPLGLYGFVAFVVSLVFGFVLVHYLVDPPEKSFEYELTTTVTSKGETVINAFAYCGSDEDWWNLITFAWMALLLVPGCLLSFIASRVKEDMNDTNALAMVFCAHLLFLVAWVSAFAILRDTAMNEFTKYSSFLLSADTIVAIGLYFLPKFLHVGDDIEEEILPDVFVHTTVALLDVQGFTAWSSVREPVQVFQFLEQLYENFDKIAEKGKVYKVETVGECYVAATGIPYQQSDHAVLMSKFAAECMRKMPKFVKKMEVKFGPDTGDLTLRVGMHSGPVTGGFLKGKGARFQLFGDTMNTASLIQSQGESQKIHLSQTTADLLIRAGKRKWIMEREQVLHTLEKGEMKTYWLVKHGSHGDDHDASSFAGSGKEQDTSESEGADLESEERWIEWNLEVFKGLLHQIVARRGTVAHDTRINTGSLPKADMPLSEVEEIIELPKFDKRAAKRLRENDQLRIPDKVTKQLKEYITEIADRYNNNHFHNFAHASYVVMAVTKYLNRILAATDADLDGDERMRTSGLAALHDHTYGITSDALTQFACVFSALIHDVDHPGVPNPQLIKEDEVVALKYQNRSVAEQKSLDIAWELLMEARFSDLLATICHGESELRRFRQLVVNAIMATDLGDKEMKALRNNRWEKAFAKVDSSTSTGTDSSCLSPIDEETGIESQSTRVNRKATIVIEHLIQAADVAHMSQHWNIYRKWNERLFRESYEAYRTGRAASNPADGWHKGEIGFFDFYIIPLSKKLRDCGVFGPTSDENVNYALNNRNMWERNGQAITEEMHERVAAEYEKYSSAKEEYQDDEYDAPIPIECASKIPQKFDGEIEA